MYTDIYNQIKADKEYQTLVKRRKRFALSLTIIILFVYFSFILTLAYAPNVFAIPLSENGVTTLGIPVGVGIIVFSFILTGIYVRKANHEFDTILNRLKDDLGIQHD